CVHLGSIGLSQGLLIGNQQGTILTPPVRCAAWLWVRMAVRTAGLRCQGALSQTQTRVVKPRAAAWVAPQLRNWVVMALAGGPSTKRSQTSSVGPALAAPLAADWTRTSSP